MTTFIADFIFGKRDRRPRSRPSPAQRLLAQFRPSAPPHDARPAEPARIDTGPALSRRTAPAEDGRPGLRP
jgi:hypothetical protein